MSHPHLEDFSHTWCKELLSSASVEQTFMDSLQYSGPTGPNENSFFARTIATSSTIRACIPMYQRSPDESFAQALLLTSLGTGLSSHSTYLAGSLSTVFLDETMGLAARQIFSRSDVETFFTVDLRAVFLKPVPTPSIILSRGKILKREGRKLWTEGTIEDGKGTVYVRGTATFVKVSKAKL